MSKLYLNYVLCQNYVNNCDLPEDWDGEESSGHGSKDHCHGDGYHGGIEHEVTPAVGIFFLNSALNKELRVNKYLINKEFYFVLLQTALTFCIKIILLFENSWAHR